MKRILFFILLVFSFAADAQVKQQIGTYGIRSRRMQSDSALRIPTVQVGIKDAYAGFDTAQIYYRKSDSSILTYTGSQWILARGAGGAGTVTSVGLSMPSAFTVANSPVTGAGTLAVTGAGTTSQYIRGDGSLSTFNTDARGSISLTTTGTSGASTYNSSTGALNIPQYSGGSLTGGLQFSFAQNVNHGYFWVQDTSYGSCIWQGWVKVTEPNSTGYFISDGNGGQHNVLLGVISGPTHAQVSGNFYDGSTIHSYTSKDYFEIDQWVHVSWIYDGTDFRVLINGITSFLEAYTGVRKFVAGGSNGILYIGGSDHNNFPGIVKQVRGVEGGDGGVGYQDRDITTHFTEYFPDGTKASFFGDYSVEGVRSFVDRGVGYGAKSHHGYFSNGAESLSYGYPTFVQGDVTQDTTAATPGSVPGSALVYDSYSRRNKLYMWGETGGLDSTEGGSLGKKQWLTGHFLGGSGGAGILCNRAVLYSGQVENAWVATSSQDADIRVDRGGDEFGTGILARYQNSDNYYRVLATDTDVTFVFKESGVVTYPSSFTGLTGGWTTLRVVVSGTTMTVYLDATNVGTKTIISNPSGVNHGITIPHAVNWYDNFTIY